MGHIDLYYQHRVDTRFADDDYRSKIPRFSPDHMAHNVAMAEYVNSLAHDKGAAPTQEALTNR